MGPSGSASPMILPASFGCGKSVRFSRAHFFAASCPEPRSKSHINKGCAKPKRSRSLKLPAAPISQIIRRTSHGGSSARCVLGDGGGRNRAGGRGGAEPAGPAYQGPRVVGGATSDQKRPGRFCPRAAGQAADHGFRRRCEKVGRSGPVRRRDRKSTRL